ncbi:hypothetical protein KIN20_017643 [Parelaphostrongylus tenuis]|uniref:Uncharacterized protein n=1 Tax=Parelaphostrongylus tenuis TaxID=148309 RepID=A0AAD5QRK6_PARTN|nr:hypothetical protein KIN20_017643 [Parelaphostrongylus tenuis]
MGGRLAGARTTLHSVVCHPIKTHLLHESTSINHPKLYHDTFFLIIWITLVHSPVRILILQFLSPLFISWPETFFLRLNKLGEFNPQVNSAQRSVAGLAWEVVANHEDCQS